VAHVRTLSRTDETVAHEVRWRQPGKFKQRTFKVKHEAERFALRVEDEVLCQQTIRDALVTC
jgi:hypothetical protein